MAETIGDWLTLNGLDAETCLALLDPPAPDAATADDPPLDDPTPWATVIAGLRRALPAAAGTLARVTAEVRIDLAPDTARFPRAFTLHDDGRGVPFVSCPLKGRYSDLLLLAHELGHTCQLMASNRPDLPPVLRETAACLAETLTIAAAAPEQRAVLDPLYRARTRRIMQRHGATLRRALADPASRYSYSWNYPLARALAGRAARHLPAPTQWRLFTGAATLAELGSLPR